MPYFGLPALDMSQILGQQGIYITTTNAFYAGVSLIIGSQLFKTRASVKQDEKGDAMLVG